MYGERGRGSNKYDNLKIKNLYPYGGIRGNIALDNKLWIREGYISMVAYIQPSLKVI